MIIIIDRNWNSQRVDLGIESESEPLPLLVFLSPRDLLQFLHLLGDHLVFCRSVVLTVQSRYLVLYLVSTYLAWI